VVLEIGVGSGLNLPFYSPAVKQLYAVDPSAEQLAMARRRRKRGQKQQPDGIHGYLTAVTT